MIRGLEFCQSLLMACALMLSFVWGVILNENINLIISYASFAICISLFALAISIDAIEEYIQTTKKEVEYNGRNKR